MARAVLQLLPAQADDLEDACGSDPDGLCRWVFERWHNADLATFLDWVVQRPLRILLIVLGGLVLTRLVRRAVNHFTERLTSDESTRRLSRLRSGRAGRILLDQEIEVRSRERAHTLSTVLSSAAAMVIWSIVVLLVLSEVDVELAPLIAGAGIAGIALGFGAQSMVKDFLSGFFIIAEDQYGVGDVIDVREVSGSVERVSLRTTVLRDVNGVVWHIPNGEITHVGNKSQLWSRAVLDVLVAYDTDLRLAQGVIQRVADELWRDDAFTGGGIIEPPEVWGVESIVADGVLIRVALKTDPAEQWGVARELRLRIKEAFDEAGITMPYPQRQVWLASVDAAAGRPDPASIRVAPIRRPGGAAILHDEPDDR